MKITEIIGYHMQFDMPSPEAQRAQRMVELEQMAKYRAKKLQQYKDWSDPIKRAAFQAIIKSGETEAKKKLAEMFKGDADAEYAKIAVRPLTNEPTLTFKTSASYRKPYLSFIKYSRWERFKRWMITFANIWKN